ncbi:MAG TPA: PQQ-dependent sugar dehydrogenase [Polyangiales bacterium]
MTWLAAVGVLLCAGCGHEPHTNPPLDSGVRPMDSAVDPEDSAVDALPPSTVRAEFGLDTRPSNTTCKAPARPPSASPVKLERVFANVQLGPAMMMAQLPGDSARWFVALRTGRVVSFPVNAPANTPTEVLDLAGVPLSVTQAGEGGLLGIAFHPRFAQNGQLFLSFTTNGGPIDLRSTVGRMTSTDNAASFGGYTTIIPPFDQPATNHNGGSIGFGQDGHLYLGFGDGGGGGDTYRNGQNKSSFFSKILRIDVTTVPAAGKTYVIPDGNPWKNGGGEPATFAFGFRNPFRFSFDRGTGELWVGDVGQDTWEEIDKVRVGGNYGWPCREGTHAFSNDPQHCPSPTNLIDPVYEYEHPLAGNQRSRRSITGGYVYRGSALPDFQGSYVFADYETQQVFALRFDAGSGKPEVTQINDQGPNAPWVSFAEDNDGELYAVAINGQIYKLVSAGAQQPSTFPDRLSETGCFDARNPTQPAPSLIPYGVNSPLWSDGAEKERHLSLPDGTTIGIGADGDFDLPIGSVVAKSFKVDGKFVETRLLVRHDDGGWAGYSYEWNDQQTDATLLTSSKTKAVGAQTWYFPSRSDCVNCHTDAAGRTLGLELAQLDGDLVYPETRRISNQLATLEHIGVFAAALPTGIPALPAPTGNAPVDQRARSYLHANCSFCHRPNGPGRSDMDLRFARSLKDAKLCNVAPATGDLGIAGAKLLAPGDLQKSLVLVRARSTDASRMPPLASALVDPQGTKVIADWIASTTACP